MNWKIRLQLLFNKFLNNSDLNRKVDAMMAQRRPEATPAADPVGSVNKGTQILLGIQYRELCEKGVLLPFEEVQFRNFSQNGEDGILWNIFSLIGTTNKKAVEICAGNGQECNTANLVIHHGWHALMVDGDPDKTTHARQFFSSHPDTYLIPPVVVHEWVTAENVNDLIRFNGFSGEIDFLSIDVDGVDYWLWKAIEVVSPRVVMVEIQSVWGLAASVTVPYRPDFVLKDLKDPRYGWAWYAGASLQAFVKLARQKGYRLVGSNRHGFNVVFLRNDVGKTIFPEIAPEAVFCNDVSNWIYERARPLYDGLEWEEV